MDDESASNKYHLPMGVLINLRTQEKVILRSQHVFGRNAQASTTHLTGSDVSLSHAVISWVNDQWQLHDHSRNGTLVNSRYIHQCTVTLHQDAVIQFSSKEGNRWKLIRIDAPASYLISPDKERLIELTAESDDASRLLPEISFFFSRESIWYAEEKGNAIELKEGQVELGGKEWLFVQNEPLEETLSNEELIRQAHFQFELTPDEEHIFLKLIINDLKYELGELACNSILLTLARKKLQDHQNELGRAEQGWVSVGQLVREVSREIMKDIDQYYVNVQLYRIRKKLVQLKPFGYLFSGVVERRPGELRFADNPFQIRKENRVVGEMMTYSDIRDTVKCNKSLEL